MSTEPDTIEPAVESKGLSLSNILDDEDVNLEKSGFKEDPAEGWDEEITDKKAEEGFCVECEG